jgi:cytochrome P450
MDRDLGERLVIVRIMAVRAAPAGLPIVGHAGSYLSDRLAFFARCADRSGAAVRCRLNGEGHVLNSPEDIRHVLVRNSANYVKSRRAAGPRAAYPPPHSLLTSEGAEHRRKRQALHAVFRHGLVEQLSERSRENAGRLAETWEDGELVEVHDAMTALAQRNILETLFGSAGEQRLEALARASAVRREAFERLFFSLFPLPEYLPVRVNRDHWQATRRLRTTIAGEIAARRAASQPADDLLSRLMAAAYADGAPLTDREVIDEVLMISLTGYDSVSEALSWALYLLARNPEAEAKVAAEAGADGAPYSMLVVREAVRLFPPTWLFVRVARESDLLPSGGRIPAESKVYLCPWIVHRNPRYWPEPDKFDPDRFADGAARERPRYAYFPFGGGPHVCIGETLALSQVVAVLAGLTARRRLALTGAREVRPEGGLTLRPRGGLIMRARTPSG